MVVDTKEKLEQEPCEYKEYEKDLNKLKAQILEEGDTLVSKQDLLDRFVEVDREYKNSPWNLLQILTNIDLLIGEESCDDCISRQAALDCLTATGLKKFDFILDARDKIKNLSSVTPTHIEQESVLDKIREEIKEFAEETIESSSDYDDYASIRYCLVIVDKYIKEIEG